MRSQLNAYRESLNHPDGADLPDLDYLAGTVAAVAVAAVALEDTSPVRDATSMRQHIGTKAYRERQRKRIAMGHKADDHGDEETQTQTWTMSM